MSRFLILFAFIMAMPSMAGAQSMDALCKSISNGAAYRPNIDAHGRPVAPADAGGGMDMTPGVYTIPLTIDVARRIQVPAGTEMESTIGFLQVTRDGHVAYNGKDFTEQSKTACRNGAAAPMPVLKDQAGTAQPPPNVINLSHRDHGPLLRQDDTGDPEDTPHDQGAGE